MATRNDLFSKPPPPQHPRLPRISNDRRRTFRDGNQRYFLTTLGIKKPGQVNGCHSFLFNANHKRATASEGVEYKSSYPSYPAAVHRHLPPSKIREKNFSPHAVMSSERVGRNQLSVGASSPSE